MKRLRLARTLVMVAATLLSACKGDVTLPPSQPPPPGEPPPPLVPEELPLRRLSAVQFQNTVRDVLTRALGAPEADAVLQDGAVASQLQSYPRDLRVSIPGESHGGFFRMDQGVQQGHIDIAYSLGLRVGELLGSNTSRRGLLLGSCATDASAANDEACLVDFISRFGRLALRRPLDADDVAFYREAVSEPPVSPLAVQKVVALLLTAPEFLYFVEHGQSDAAGTVTRLTAHELAARLSYHFWQTLPDELLTEAADSGALLTDAGYRQQVERLMGDARAHQALGEFFSQWFRLDDLEEFDRRVGDPIFDAFRGDFTPTRDTRERINGEVADLVAWLVSHEGTLQDVLTDRHAFARSADLAALYGVPRWDGTSQPPTFSEPQRSGLLTRIAFLATGSANTRPIIKGYRIRNALLCGSIPPPPADAMMTRVELSPELTTREVVERLTETQGSCPSCHRTRLNPLGFVTENFDALGRFRSTQRLFDNTGQQVGERPVRTDTVPAVVPGDTRSVSSAAEVTQLILDSGQYEECFARQYFRYTFARPENDASDEPVLEALRTAARSRQSLRTVLASVALRPEFQRKDFR
ncbi:DUF1592 domain-containing protein [Myxococcus sp. K38C18041901]|uniref:DUF1592 domain-containing protein n=1 Tax=Myxococcus guangdongensis TaxID=2906760 RepID=UPI0020A7FCEA|nr:DUF1592 domain-containing protein [Myxococcus guangdongensis]MCP3062245.1 DUF1592 domain-containing protein [Myxococcus guangdongensis]